ncbi:MAG: hypothetical protein R3321_05565 [Nitrososphaeraceae archaeon]|nr:hypothetical protein [Nitrososphaeraceae archaeon]
MYQDTLLVKKELTPEMLFPRWTEMLDYLVGMNEMRKEFDMDQIYQKKKRQLDIDMASTKACIVGESHAFDDGYESTICSPLSKSCHDCSMFGMKFVSLLNNVKFGLVADWRNDDTVLDFISHFNKSHL